MPFEFSLQRLLNLTDGEKSQLEYEYGRVYNMLEAVAEKLLQLLNKRDQINDSLEEKIMKQGTPVSLLRKQRLYLDTLENLILEQQARYNEIRNELEKNKALLLEKSIEVKKFEKLKHREATVYRKNTNIRELRDLDEVASHKFFYH